MIDQCIDHPSAWTGASIRGKETLAFDLGRRHLAAFENGPSPDARRHLLRLWLHADDARPVVPELEVFDFPGIPPQPGRSPSGEGEHLPSLGAKSLSKAETDSAPNA